MSVKTVRTNGDANRPTYGANMLTSDSPQNTKAGLNINSDGQPEIWDKNGNLVFELPHSSVAAQERVKLNIVGTAGTGIKAAMANPFGYAVLISMAVLNITTQSSGASTWDIGVAADASTGNDGLIDGLSGAAAGLFTNTEDPGTNGEQSMVWGASQFITVNAASGSGAALIADLYLTVARL